MLWNPLMPLINLPKNIRKFFVDDSDFLFNDLMNHRLSVVLVPAPFKKFLGHKIRVVETRNPFWYSDLYRNNSGFRRDLSLKSLDRLRNLKDRTFRSYPYRYDFIYRKLVYERQTSETKEEGYVCLPNNKVLEYFGLRV